MPDYNNFEPGKVIVALNSNFINPHSVAGYTHMLGGIDFESVDIIFQSGKNDSSIGDIILVHLRSNEKSTVMDAVEALLGSPYVIYAEPSYYIAAHVIPNDQYFDYLWGAKKINSPLAWTYTTGSPRIIVGVTDSGIDHNHPDLHGNMWISPDGLNGRNFFNTNQNIGDTTGHGTHVAGTIGAVGNNFIGITGICWNVKIASLRIGHIYMSLSAAIGAIHYANMHNITILNNSWGGDYYSPLLKFAIEQYNGLFIASAGNDALDSDYFPDYPASYDSENIISVAATDANDSLTPFSNYGVRSIDIAAPGIDIFSTSLNNGYDYQSGTSMAAPHVAGAAALLKSYIPDLTSLEIKDIILSSASKSRNLEGKVLTGGILNVNAMLETAIRKR